MKILQSNLAIKDRNKNRDFLEKIYRIIYILGICAVLSTASSCKFDPTAKELITHVPVEFSLEAVTPFNVHRFDLSEQIIASVLGPSVFSEKNLNLLANSPSSSNFNDTAVTSFQVRSGNGATYYFSLSGNQIQRQSDRISLTIPNMPVGQATLGGIMFLTSGGVVNSASDTPATNMGVPFTGIWATAGSGGDVPIDISSTSASTQTISVPLIDTTAGNNGPHLTRSDVKINFCKGAGLADSPGSSGYDAVGGCSAGSNWTVANINTNFRFSIAGAYSKWYNLNGASPLDATLYLMLSANTPNITLQFYCTAATCASLLSPSIWYTGCPFRASSNILDTYDYSSQVLYLYFQQCS